METFDQFSVKVEAHGGIDQRQRFKVVCQNEDLESDSEDEEQTVQAYIQFCREEELAAKKGLKRQ